MATTSTPPPLPPDWQQAHLVETFKALHTIAIEGLKMLALINGGAAVAVLTYAGNADRQHTHISGLVLPIGMYCVGLL